MTTRTTTRGDFNSQRDILAVDPRPRDGRTRRLDRWSAGACPRSTSKSAVSRRFVTGTNKALDQLLSRDLSELHTIFNGTPADKSNDAAECRSSCGVHGPIPAAVVIAFTRRVTLFGSR